MMVGRIITCDVDPDATVIARRYMDESGFGDRKDFNEHVANDDRVVSVMLTVRDGMTLVQKR